MSGIIKPKTTQFFQSSTPVLLASSCFLDAGMQNTPQMNDLSYPFRKPLLIDEIRFTIIIAGEDNRNLGALVYVKFMLGQMYLMRDPVPVASLATFMSLADEQYAGEPYSENVNPSHYRWRLPQPLYIEAGQYLQPIFSRPANEPAGVSSDELNVLVSYAGRVVPPNAERPKVIPVPYAAPFVTPLNPAGGYVQSNEYHLFNPFDRPITVQRLTGRYYVYTQHLPGVFAPPQLQTGITPGPLNAQNVTVRLADSWGGKMVNNFVGPADVFDIQRTAWTFDTVMPPKGQYDAQIWNIPGNTSVHLAMIGTREEAI